MFPVGGQDDDWSWPFIPSLAPVPLSVSSTRPLFLGAGDAVMSKTDMVPAFMELDTGQHASQWNWSYAVSALAEMK